jgi:catechol 2,3-dioxygenase-like lactoylglutathione lyase family enzyme
MRLMSLRLGTNDLAKSCAFYDATFGALGVAPSAMPEEYQIGMWDLGGVKFLVGGARNGEPCTYANGGTIVFEAPDEEAVKAWHAAGLAHGGADEGVPESKPQARGAFGAYLRDPDGNKISAYAGLQMG